MSESSAVPSPDSPTAAAPPWTDAERTMWDAGYEAGVSDANAKLKPGALPSQPETTLLTNDVRAMANAMWAWDSHDQPSYHKDHDPLQCDECRMALAAHLLRNALPAVGGSTSERARLAEELRVAFIGYANADMTGGATQWLERLRNAVRDTVALLCSLHEKDQ